MNIKVNKCVAVWLTIFFIISNNPVIFADGNSENVTITFANMVNNMVSPQDAKVNVEFIISGAQEKNYTIEYSAQDSGEKLMSVGVAVPANKKTVETVPLKGIKNGEQVISVSVKDGDRLVKSFSQKIAIIPGYTPQFMESFTQRGICTHFDQENQGDDKEAELLNRAGVKNVRDELMWHKTEIAKGEFDFARHDKWYPAMTKNGILLDGVLDAGNPLYLEDSSIPEASKYGPRTKEQIAAYCNYAAQTIKHYPELRRTEIWNEPQLGSFWKPKPNLDEYNDMLKAVSATIRKNDPNIKIVGAVTAGTNTKWVSEMFDKGAYSFVDDISFHPYIYPNLVDSGWDSNIASMEATILKYGGWKKMAITEVGWPTHIGGNGVTEDTQATEAIKQYVVADSMGIDGDYFYTFRDSGDRPDYNEHRFGIIRRDYSPKPAYIALTQMNAKLAGALSIGEIKLTDTIRAFLYRKNGAFTLVLWSTKGDEEYDFGTETVHVEDLMGNEIQSPTVHFDRRPIYVEGVNNIWVNKFASSIMSKGYTSLIQNWQAKIANESIIQNLKQLADNAQQLGDKTDLLLENEISDKISLHYNQGTEVIKILSSGQSKLNDLQTAQFLYELNKIGKTWGDLLAASANPSEVPTALDSQNKLKLIKKQMDDRTKDIVGGSLIYSQAMERYARDFSMDALKVKSIKQDNPSKAGVIKSWDRMSVELLNWVELLSNVEKVQSTTVLMQLNSQEASVYVGVSKNVNASVNNLSDQPVTGKLKLYNESGEAISESKDVTVPANQSANVTFPVLLKTSNKEGKVNCTLKFIQNDKELTSKLVTFILQDKVNVSMLPVMDTLKELKAVKLKVKNIFDTDISGEITVVPPQGWSLKTTKQPISIGSQMDQELEFQVTKTERVPFNYYVFGCTIKDKKGDLLLQREIPLSFTAVVQNKKVVDPNTFSGDISGWADAYPFFINPPAQADSSQEWHDTNISVMTLTKWDANYFYLLSNVYDNEWVNKRTGSQIWDGDAIQISIDGENIKANDYKNVIEYGFARTEKGNEAYSWQVAGGGKAGEEPSEWVQVIRDEKQSLTRYLIRIPKERLEPMQLESGYKFGFNMGINDSDYDSRESCIDFMPGTTVGKNASQYATWMCKPAETAPKIEDVTKYKIPVAVTMENHNDLDVNTRASMKGIAANEQNTSGDASVTPESKTSFQDLIGHWAKNDIEEMISKGIVKGVNTTSFAPDAQITRAEFLALITRVINLTPVKFKGNIKDIADDIWYADTVQAALDAGLIPQEMLADNQYKPESAINREEMTALLINAYNKKIGTKIEGGSIDQFSNKGEIAPWAEKYVKAACNLGFINGVSANQFAPKANADRAQAAVIVKRLLSKMES